MHSFAKPSLVLAALALTVVPGLKTIAKAQCLSNVPSCASPALFSAIQGAGCGFTEVKCICSKKDSIFPSVASAIACDPADQAAVEALASTYCGSSSTAAGTTPAVPAAAPMPTATWTESTSMSTTGMTVTTSTSTRTVLTTHSSTMSSTTYHRTMTYSTTFAPLPVETGGAVQAGVSAGALALAVAGLSWVFAEL